MIALKLLVHIFIKGRDSKLSYMRWNRRWYYKCGPQYQEIENKCLEATSDPLPMFVNKVLLYTNIPIYFYFIFCFFTTKTTMLNTTRTRFIWCLAFDWTTNLCRVPNSLTHNLIRLWRGGQDQQASPPFTDLETVVKRLALHISQGFHKYAWQSPLTDVVSLSDSQTQFGNWRISMYKDRNTSRWALIQYMHSSVHTQKSIMQQASDVKERCDCNHTL